MENHTTMTNLIYAVFTTRADHSDLEELYKLYFTREKAEDCAAYLRTMTEEEPGYPSDELYYSRVLVRTETVFEN
jgi:hypothetical protein